MRKTIVVMVGVALLAACGCQKGVRGGSEAGGAGFRIDVPNMTQEIRQGEVKTITVKVDRGDYFKQDVRLTIHQPEGIMVDPTNLVVPRERSAQCAGTGLGASERSRRQL